MDALIRNAAGVEVRARLFAEDEGGYFPERMLEGAGIGIERGCSDAQAQPGFAPPGDGGEDLPKDPLRCRDIEPEAGGSRQRTIDGRWAVPGRAAPSHGQRCDPPWFAVQGGCRLKLMAVAEAMIRRD